MSIKETEMVSKRNTETEVQLASGQWGKGSDYHSFKAQGSMVPAHLL